MKRASENIPAGFELVDDMPMHRYERTWTTGRNKRTTRPVEPEARKNSKRPDRP